jgi:hypothetical protein
MWQGSCLILTDIDVMYVCVSIFVPVFQRHDRILVGSSKSPSKHPRYQVADPIKALRDRK